MKELIDGYTRFRKQIFPTQRPLFQRLATGQSPSTLLITCSDSRIVPDLIMQTEPGDLFICRNAGNMVPPYSDRTGGVSATIEYAVLALNIESIVVCGHSDCGAMKGVLHPEKLKDMPTVASWLHHADTARRLVHETYPALDEQGLLRAVTEENVIAQLDHLRTHPSVASRLAQGRLQLFGWVFDIHSGELKSFDPALSGFVPLDARVAPSATAHPRLRQFLPQGAA